MTYVVWAFALIGAAVHLLVFVWETLLFKRPGIHRDIFQVPSTDVPPVHLWAFNVGIYNLLVGGGAVAGVIAWAAGNETVGKTLVVYTTVFMLVAGIGLFVSDRLALSRPRGAGVVGALAQSVPPLIALGALAV